MSRYGMWTFDAIKIRVLWGGARKWTKSYVENSILLIVSRVQPKVKRLYNTCQRCYQYFVSWSLLVMYDHLHEFMEVIRVQDELFAELGFVIRIKKMIAIN